MGVLEACKASMRGWFDVFDRVQGLMDYIIDRLDEEPVAVHGGEPLFGIPAHFDSWPSDKKAEMVAAKEQLREIETLAVETLAGLS